MAIVTTSTDAYEKLYLYILGPLPDTNLGNRKIHIDNAK